MLGISLFSNISKRLFVHFKRIDQLKCSLASSPLSSVTSNKQGQMLLYQNSLPSLPVPPLHPTLEKYLLSVRPLLNEEEYHQTEKLSEWWLQTAYLEYRMPVVVYSSPGLVFPLQNFTSQVDQLRYAAKLVSAALEYKLMIDQQVLPPDMMGNQPLDMSQYLKIFSTCRIPAIPSDCLIHFSEEPEPPKHITVAHNNHYFQVNVFGSDGAPLNERQIFSQLELVVAQSKFPKKPIGVLTTEHRDTWAKAYKRLCKYDKLNKESVKTIQSSIFLLCLDQSVPNNAMNKRTHAALQTIHGGGSKENSGNRWFDKTIQFIVGADGVVGLTYEHSPSEGPPIANLMDYIVQYMNNVKSTKRLPSAQIDSPKKLRFNLSSDTLADIEEAERDLDVLISDLEMSCFQYRGFGREFVKSQRLSPDSFIQIALQLAFYRLHKQLGATYESASTRKFLHGRTETIRSASVEALDFCLRMLDKTAASHVKAAALRTAVDSHKEYTNQAINGLGVDRLLLGLKKCAIENGLNVPELFMDTGFQTSTHFRLSTSQVPSKSDAFMCYGPSFPDGYGCCYNPLPEFINFGVSACNSSPETLSSKFMEALEQSLTEMHDILLLSQNSKL
ncbi:carnitine O-acetyltransferase-like isoform X2 [Centruroides vittatus]|uniref:carnitine O-acetyltransferase-like isoform X2 n=1 Tax=Centruroides vittatus TaxID=120091 RepID=UPI0035105742